MADVTGRIGNEDVVLNNAATEATLRLLLQATMAANKQNLTAIQNLAQNSGLNPQAIAAANAGLSTVGTGGSRIGKSFEALGFAAGALSSTFKAAGELGEKLASGGAQASDVFATFGKLPGIAGVIFQQFQKLANIQESYLATYQQLSSAGINFGGSLTDMRMAASNAYTTLEGFSNLMKNNSEAFSRMGGTAEQGARSFINVANTLQKSDLGTNLRALGYTSDQLNQGLASYIEMTGGRNAQEMRDTRALSSAAGEYLTQLDELAEITGKTREQQEQALKEASANQAYQAYLMTLDEEGRKKANAAMAEAMATGGKGAADALQAQMMGLPPMTKAAQEFTAVAPKMADANRKMADAVNDSTKGVNDVKKASDAMRAAAVETKEDLGDAGKAIIMSGGTLSETIGKVFGAANRSEQQGIKTAEDAEKQRENIQARQKERMDSEASDAAETQKKLQELGNTIMAAVLPVLKAMLPVVNSLIDGFTFLTKPLVEFASLITNSSVAMNGILPAIGVATAAIAGIAVAVKGAQLASTIKTGVMDTLKTAGGAVSAYKQAGGGKAGLAAGFKSVLSGSAVAGKADGSKENPYYVIMSGGGAGGGGGVVDQLIDAATGKGGSLLDKIKGKMPSGVLEKLMSGAGGLSKFLGPAARVLGKVAVPAAIGMSAYDAYKGFTADKESGMGTRLMNAGSSALSGLTFGLLGSSPEEIAAKVKKSEGNEKTSEQSKKELEEKESKEGGKSSLESLSVEVSDLNKIMLEMLKYTKEMTDNTKRTMEGVKALNPNLFPS